MEEAGFEKAAPPLEGVFDQSCSRRARLRGQLALLGKDLAHGGALSGLFYRFSEVPQLVEELVL